MHSKFGLTSSTPEPYQMTSQEPPDAPEEVGTGSEPAALDVAPGASLRPRVLLAEDDADMRALLAWSLRREHYNVTECVDGLDLVSKLGTFVLFGEPVTFDLVISDIRMPGATALEILEAMRECEGLPAVILITGFGDSQTHDEADRLGVAAVFDKPFEVDDLLAKARELLQTGRTRAPLGLAQKPSPAAKSRCPGDRTSPHGDSASEGCGQIEGDGRTANATQHPRYRAPLRDALGEQPKPPEMHAGKAPARVIVAEDDRDMRELLTWTLRRRGHEVIECASGASLLHLFDAPNRDFSGIDLIISDVRMPYLTGLEALKRIRSKAPSTPLIVMTAFPEVETRVTASELGVAALFTKPFEISDLCSLVDRILSWRTRKQQRQSFNNHPSAGAQPKD